MRIVLSQTSGADPCSSPLPTPPATLSTDHIFLVPLSPDFLRCTSEGRRADAVALLGHAVPAEWFDHTDFAALRLRQFEEGRTQLPWLPRAIIARDSGAMVGYIGFHTPPNPAYLAPTCPGAVEFGYTVFTAHRRRGYALAASRALMHWAHSTHGVTTFVVSVSPANSASLALVARLGFRRIGSQVDEIDGPEDIFSLVLAS